MASDSQSLDELLNDPGVSYPLKAVLLVWWSRDPLDAANDAAALATVFGDRLTRRLEACHGP